MFSDDQILERVKTQFVPFAGNTNELQVGRSPERDWFMRAIKPLHPGAERGGTAQGFYVLGADGSAYAFDMHSRAKEAFNGLLDRGLQAFAQRPPQRVEIAGSSLTWSRQAPEGTLRVRTIARVSPIPEGAPGNNAQIGRDHYWLMPTDVQALLAETRRTFPMPRPMAMRLARFHLVDNVRGEPDRWRRDDVRRADFRVMRHGDGRFTFRGPFEMVNPRRLRGYVGSFEGELGIDPRSGRAVSFEAFADGQAWGDHSNTSGAPKGRFPVKIAFRSVDDEVARNVPPQLSYFWAEYADPLSPVVVPWP